MYWKVCWNAVNSIGMYTSCMMWHVHCWNISRQAENTCTAIFYFCSVCFSRSRVEVTWLGSLTLQSLFFIPTDTRLSVRSVYAELYQCHIWNQFGPYQFKYSPRNKDGLGLTDGEVVERFWAYLRRFSRMTKEMRPSHRVDVLTDAALHYSRKSAQRLSSVNILCECL